MSKDFAKRLVIPIIMILVILLEQIIVPLFRPYRDTLGYIQIGGIFIDWLFVLIIVPFLVIGLGISLFLISIINKRMK